jgi:glycosyltransferase involved in cell wall biosynthesis
MRPLRLAVDAGVVDEDTRGIGRYARALLRRIAVRDDVELLLLRRGPLAFRHRARLESALESDRFRIRSDAPAQYADVVWHPANGTFFRTAVPAVATIHDAVPFRFPDPDERRRERAQAPFLRSVRTAKRFIAVSEFGRNELAAVFGIAPARIDVIYHGVEASFAPGPAQPLPAGVPESRYFLFVGDPAAEPRKNFPLLYDAYRRAFSADRRPPSLVIAGSGAPQLPGVIDAGRISDDLHARANDVLRALYRGAIALALASYHETFGMPLVEAMACGTPVIASDAGSLPEIGADAALYAPPGDAVAWAAALRRVYDDAVLRDRLRTLGLERATLFDWDESAERHLEVFRATAAA